MTSPRMREVFTNLQIESINSGACGRDWITSPHPPELASVNPATEAELARVQLAGAVAYEQVVAEALQVWHRWRVFPAPKRGQLIRSIGEELRRYKDELGALVTFEMGKIYAEGKGEVQEMIDVADFAVGLSRQLYGLTIQSERPRHRMYEQWHPLGLVGVISAFNFPVAVWSWNALIAAACGDCVIWKPSLKAPLCAIAVQKICHRVLKAEGWEGVFSLVIGTDQEIGERLIRDQRIPLISATGSTKMGRHVGEIVSERMGRTLLELGGNNAVIVTGRADLDLALRGVLFGAVGTAGQRCTTIRRLFLQNDIATAFKQKLVSAYGQLRIGDPMDDSTLIGPLIDEAAVDSMESALAEVKSQGGRILCGGGRVANRPGYYVIPALVEAAHDMAIVQRETFAPILYIIEFNTLEEAIEWHNAVPQGLSSAIFTNSLHESEAFLGAGGSDCGIANVNVGTSGAEIGGAFGGEKETGGGRESGSDAWKTYMRRQTVTVNWSGDLPLSQGIKFSL